MGSSGMNAFPGEGNLKNRRWQWHAYVSGDCDLQDSYWLMISGGRRGGGLSPFRISQHTDTPNDRCHADDMNSQHQWRQRCW